MSACQLPEPHYLLVCVRVHARVCKRDKSRPAGRGQNTRKYYDVHCMYNAGPEEALVGGSSDSHKTFHIVSSTHLRVFESRYIVNVCRRVESKYATCTRAQLHCALEDAALGFTALCFQARRLRQSPRDGQTA